MLATARPDGSLARRTACPPTWCDPAGRDPAPSDPPDGGLSRAGRGDSGGTEPAGADVVAEVVADVVVEVGVADGSPLPRDANSPAAPVGAVAGMAGAGCAPDDVGSAVRRTDRKFEAADPVDPGGPVGTAAGAGADPVAVATAGAASGRGAIRSRGRSVLAAAVADDPAA
jgi:hypothetical protein